MAHGLVLKLEEMLQRNLVCRKDPCEVLSEEDKIIKSWSVANASKFYKLDFYRLLRKTLLCILSSQSLKELKKRELLNEMTAYFNRHSHDLRNNLNILEIGKHLSNVIRDPWQNLYFSWDQFFQQKISINDQNVQEYFANEPEDIVMARVHAFVIQGKEEMAMILAKSSYMYHSRIAKSLCAADASGYKVKPGSVLLGKKYKKGIASIDWYLFILQRKKILPAIVNEINQLMCHESVQLIQRLSRSKKNNSFIFTMLQILIMQELMQPSKYCCTKKIFSLWCFMHKEKKSGVTEINQAIRKMLALHAPSSAHFYLLADSLWDQFGEPYITVYVELYVRGLSVDLNHLEAAKHREDREDTNSLESHIAFIFTKLSTLFSSFHDGAARECMFSAFSLRPSKERLYILQSLTHSILSTKNEIKLSYSMNAKVSQECKCDMRCDGHCQDNKEFCLEHPILKKGIHPVPFLLIKDFVCVLESVRCFQFQYNIFDWHNNATDLGDYLKEYNLMKSWESDTEYASEGSSRSDLDDSSEKPSCSVPQINESPFHLSVKRKSEPGIARELFSLDVGANIEVINDGNLHKKMKMLEHNVINEINSPEVFNRHVHSVQNFASPVAMEDAIENVIRMTLDKKQKPDIYMNNNNFINTSLDHDHDGIKNFNLSSVSKHTPGNHVYPYTLTSLGKVKHLNSNYNSPEYSEKSSPENTREYMPNFPSKSSNACETLRVSRESVISPVSSKNFIPIQEKPCNSSAQTKPFSIKTESVSSYNYNNDNMPTSVHAGQKISSKSLKKVSMFQQLPYNLGSNKQISVYYSNAQNSVVPGRETLRQALPSVNTSTLDYSKSQFISHTSISSSSSMTSPANMHSKNTSMQNSVYPTSHSMPQSSVYGSDSRYQLADHSSANIAAIKQVDQSVSCYDDNQLLHCDRGSVIQHTMHHVQENSDRDELTIPNLLTVSVNTNTPKEICCAPQNDAANLPPLTVNVSDRAMSGSSAAVPASVVLNRKYQQLIDQPVSNTQPVSNNPSITTSETSTIPGILASPSVIVTPWETQIKSHGEMMYKKSMHVVNACAVDKKIYKNRPPYMKHIILKPEQKIAGQIVSVDKANLQHVFKTIPSADTNSLGILPSAKQSQSNSIQNWQVVKASQEVSKPSSQPNNIQNWQVMNKPALQSTYSKPIPVHTRNIQNWHVACKSSSHVVSKSAPQVAAKSAPVVKSAMQVAVKSAAELENKLTHQRGFKPSSPVSNIQNWQVMDKSTSQQITKPTLIQPSNILNCQVVNKSTSQVVSNPTSSQPWYSEPYPKNSVTENNISSKPAANSGTVHQNVSPNIKLLQTNQVPNMKSFSIFANEESPRILASTALTHGATVKSYSNVSHSSNLTAHASSKEPLLNKNFIASSSNSQLVSTKNVKFSATQCNKQFNKPLNNQFSDSTTNTILVQEKSPDAFIASNVLNINRHYCQTSSENFPNACCSPTEVNPCQTCSLPTAEVNTAQTSTQKSSNCLPDQQLPTPNQKKMIAENTLVASAFHSSCQSKDDGDATRIMPPDSDIGEALATCQYCSQCFAARELEVHILHCHPKVFNNENYDTVISSNEMLPENDCALKDLPDIAPVRSTLFHIESFPNNLPHSTSENQGNANDVEDIEANAFSVCMDLINSDQDLKRIVQGIESLDQMENNYLTFMPSAGAPNLVNANIGTEIQKSIEPVVPYQNLVVGVKSEFNNSTIQPNNPEFASGRIHSVNSRGNIFEFTEKDYEASKPAQKLIHSKPQTSFTEKISPNYSKNTNEAVTFSTIAEMIKATISDGCDGELDAFETLPKVNSKEKLCEVINNQKTELEFWFCQYCSKKLRSAKSLKRHILKLHPNQNIDSQADVPQKFDSVSPSDLHYNYPPSANDLSVNSSHIESSGSVTPMTAKNPRMSNISEMSPLPPKGRVRSSFKSPTIGCKICGKVLTAGYMKTHMLKQHSGQQNEISVKTEISSSDPYDATVSSSSQVESSNFPTVSAVTEQDIDSSTCLSASDAVTRIGSYTIADASNLSDGSDKVLDSTNVKFNFNDLEFSKDVHTDGKATTTEDQNLFPKLKTSFSENVELEDMKPTVYTKNNRFVSLNHCSICLKAYSRFQNLRKHMKTIHNLDLPNPPERGKKFSKKPPHTTHEAQPNIQHVNTNENKEKTPQFSKDEPSTSKSATPALQTHLKHKSGTKFKKPLPNVNKSLLRTVLSKSVPTNLKSKQLKNSNNNNSKAIKENDSFRGSVYAKSAMQILDSEKLLNKQLSSNINSNIPVIAPESEDMCNKQLKDNIYPNLPLHISENKQNICSEPLISKDFNSSLPLQTSKNEQKMCNELLSDNLNYDLSLKMSRNEQKMCNKQLNNKLVLNNSILISENEQKLCNEQLSLNKNSEPMQLDVPLNLDFESGCNISDSVPSENLQSGETVSVQATSNFLIPNSMVSNIPSEAEQLDYFELNTILPESDILHSNHFNPPNSEYNADCGNSSVQSNEISPVSEIISNVSKYQFGRTSDGEDQKELLDDNSLKLSIPKSQRESINPENKNFLVPTPPLQELKPKLKKSNVVSSNSDLPCGFLEDCSLDTNQNINQIEAIEGLNSGIDCEKQISQCPKLKCRLCHQSLNSFSSLTKHLKDIHDIPVLKKHISKPPSVKLSSCVQESVKRSPPKLKLGPNESDSESVSDFDNPSTCLKATGEQLEMTSTHKFFDNSHITHLPPSDQCVKERENIFNTSGLFESLAKLEHTETEMQPKQPDPFHFLISDSECQRKPVTVASPCKYKFRRHSFCDTKSFFLQVKNNKSLSTAEINHLISNIDFKNNCEIMKMKSVSLPNFQVTLKHVTTSRIEHEMNKTDTSLKSVDCVPDETNEHPVKQSEVAVEDSAGENKSLNSVNVPEVSKTSCDISSENYPVQLNAIAINSDFLLPNPLLNPTSQLPPNELTKHKISHKKLLLKKIKSYKPGKIGRVKSRCFPYHKAFKPIILTLKETAEISEFLKTHKQPTVKLMRLKDDSDSHSRPLIKEVHPICDKQPLKEAVVKLERLKIPKDFGNLFLVKQKLVSNVLSQKTHFNSVTMQNAENQSINFSKGFYLRSRVSKVHTNPPIEIDLTDSNSDASCDAHENVEALAMEVKCPIQTEGCTMPLPKTCFVVLKRISV